MKVFDAAQALWFSVLLVAVALAGRAPTRPGATPPQHAAAAAVTTAALRDAEGHEIPAKRFQHIASTSGYADELLLALSEPERIAALSQAGRRSGRELFRYGARPSIASPSQIEQLLSLHVDLLLVSSYGGRSDLSRLREAGIVVFDLGEQRGTRSLEPSIRAVATLLGDPARGERLWRGWSRQLDAVARDIPAQARKPAAYVAIYANKLYGGTRGTSYHDVLTAAGLQDLAADTYRDWPQYDPEQLLLLDPPLIVTEAGMAAQLCAHAWLRSLRACAGGQAGHQTGIVEVSQNLMGSAGLGMLDAALELRQLVYPSP